jgi:hypothetical protein
MSNSNKPIFRKDQTGIEKTNPIPEIEPNKNPLNKSSPTDQTFYESTLTNFLIIKLLISCVDFFLEKTFNKSKNLPQSPEPLLVPLLQLKDKLNLLETLDCSDDVDFIQKLSEIWNNLLSIFAEIPELKLLSKEAADRLQELILDISYYPKQSDHTLGFYLTEKAGENWAPLPLIQMLKSLHELHQTNPTKSTLRCWNSMVEVIICKLNELIDQQSK